MLALPGVASAATTITAIRAPATYVGPTPTYNFDGVTPISGGTFRSTNIANVAARPTSSTGRYYAVGGPNGSPAVLSLAAFSKIKSVSFLWGSPDTHNLFQVLNGSNQVIFSRTGTDIRNLIGSNTATAFVTLNFDGLTVDNVKALRFSSSQAAFEFDTMAVTAVPEPGTWMMMLLGFGLIGGALRSRKKQNLYGKLAF